MYVKYVFLHKYDVSEISKVEMIDKFGLLLQQYFLQGSVP